MIHYLHLSADGRAYLFIGYDRYIRVDTSDATRHVRGVFAYILGEDTVSNRA